MRFPCGKGGERRCVQGNSIQRELALTGVMFLLQLVCSHPLTGETWGDAGVLSPYISRCRNNMLAASTVIKPRSNDDGWADVRGLGCRGIGPGAVRIHDVVPHRVSGVHDRACKLPRGTRSALAVD